MLTIKKRSILMSLLLIGSCAQAMDTPPSVKKSYDAEHYLKLLMENWGRVKEAYVEKIDEDKFFVGALKGAMQALDAHSEYLTEEEFTNLKSRTKGEFPGIGIEMVQEYGVVKVISPIDDTPAFEAGIKAGDYIIWIDEQPIMGMSIEDASNKIRGPKGTSVRLRIVREGQEPFDVTVKRDIIKVKPVKHRVEGEIGYIRISTFNEHTEKMLREAILDIKKQLGKKLKGFILDLRNNPGGLFDQVLTCADLFLESGEIVSVRGRDPNQTQRFSATAGDLTGGLPMAVLINAGSASCSEILAGALQDNKRAIIMGNRSFGKGSVQVVLPSKSEKGGLVLTIARYYPPSGYPIQGNGVTPDVLINQAEVKIIEDKSRREENLHNALKPAEGSLTKIDALKRERDRVIPLLEKKQQEEEERRKNPDAGKAEKGKSEKAKDHAKEDEHKSPWAQPAKVPDSEKDYQLARALDMLKAYATYSHRNDNDNKP